MRNMTTVSTTQLAQNSGDSPEFDYSSFPSGVAKFLRGQATRIRQYGTKAIIQIGKDLVGAKHYLSHGEFLRWVEHEVGISARTAQAYMRVASWASSKSATVALLPPTALYALSSPSVPTEFVKGVLRRVESGERIQLPSLRAQIRALRENTVPQNNGTSGERSGRNSDDVPGAHCTTATTAMISNAVRTLARALTVAEFEHVRGIMTSKAVLSDPNLPRILERAFGPSKPTTSDSHEPTHLYEVQSCSADLAPRPAESTEEAHATRPASSTMEPASA